MQRATTLEVRKNALSDGRLAERDLTPLGDGAVLARVDRFALTATNTSPDGAVIVDLQGSG